MNSKMTAMAKPERPLVKISPQTAISVNIEVEGATIIAMNTHDGGLELHINANGAKVTVNP